MKFRITFLSGIVAILFSCLLFANSGFNVIYNSSFKATCSAVALPFTEGFNTSSPTFDCWTTIDGNNDQLPTGNNAWRQFINTPYEGNRSMYFVGNNLNVNHDDWLISPPVLMNGEILAISYYYKTGTSGENEFELLLSENGINPSDFTTVLETNIKSNLLTYTKKTTYVSNIVGEINIAWHVKGKGSATLFIDAVSITKVDCIGPDDSIAIVGLEKDKATLSWTDSNNSTWEYYVQPMGVGAAPIGSGAVSKSTSVTVVKTSGAGGTNLQPNTSYEFFLRSSCGAGKNSLWLGPFVFKTPCDANALPFTEGFNTGSKTLECWTIIDHNKDATSSVGNNIWYPYGSGAFEGDKSMYFNGSTSKPKHDDWLISPSFTLDATKLYRLKYHVKSTASTKNDFEVLLSNKGVAVGDFTKTISTDRGHLSSEWTQRIAIVGGMAGDINIAWHVTTASPMTTLYIDNVSFEEVVGCAEPMNLGAKDEKDSSATLYWSDDFGQAWEYVVQDIGEKAPTANGIATTQKENTVNQTQKGNNLKPNSEYELYTRTVCGDGTYSIWSGPFKFRTACGVLKTPFWEGFNSGAASIYCWTIIDENADAVSPTGANIWKTATTRYEGSQAMYFMGTNNNVSQRPHNDWLISPAIKFDSGKMYRLKYHYRTAAATTNDYEFEVLLSSTGIDTKKFNTVVVAKAKYAPSDQWKEAYVYISNVSGEIHMAWHVTSATAATNLYIDNVFIEEVTSCPEPLNLGIKDLEAQKVSLLWSDDFGATHWEYYVQERGKGIPKANGTTTTAKVNTISSEQSGKSLQPNVDYEFYVRTLCPTGGQSIWQGPFVFTTLCGVYVSPFWEGFNKDSKTARCWTILDKKGEIVPVGTNWKFNSGAYEGNQALYFYVNDSKKEPMNDWLITPKITLDGGTYVLKYHYKTSASTTYNNEFEVLLSTQGIDPSNFTTTVLSSKNYRVGNYVEQVVFINGIKGDVNLAWHVKSENTAFSYLYLDHVSINKAQGCEEPYYVTTSNITTSSMDVEWLQNGGITNWEVIVVGYADDEKDVPIKTQKVSGNPKTTINGLDAGKAYKIYVRAQCEDGKTYGNWSTAYATATQVGGNDNCSGAINIPVNDDLECIKTVSGTLLEATVSTTVVPTCNSNNIAKDVWFEFTATATSHMLHLTDLKSISDSEPLPYVYATLYDQPCGSITANTFASDCFNFFPNSSEKMFLNLIPGQKYYLRLGVSPTNKVYDFIFNLCITTSKNGAIEVSPSGEKYTVEELVKDILVKSNCDVVSNVHYQVGDGSVEAQKINTIGYFNKKNSIFPFDEGIVLSTSEVKYVPGPHIGANSFRGTNKNRWVGDKDINDAILDAGGGPLPDKRVTQIEFDFVPIKDSIKFEYLFASNSYIINCMHMCDTGALFAAWLIDSTTGEGQNLAKLPGTNTSIALNNIRDASKSGISCSSANPEYYWKHYANNQDSPIAAPIDFVGMTVPMESETVKVVPGRKYHIKLAVMDFCTNVAHTSAVFFNASSFDIGTLDLGADLLVENGTALCSGASSVIKSGLGTEDNTIQWYKDEEMIPGANLPDLEVFESGVYKVVCHYGAFNCEVNGSVKVEVYPAISTVVASPKPVSFCRSSLELVSINLTEGEPDMFSKVDRNNYKVIYYQTQEDAQSKENPIAQPINYLFKPDGKDVMIYLLIEDIRTGCSEIFELTLKATEGSIPTAFDNVTVCDVYTFPDLESNQRYYLESGASGKEYKAGENLNISGKHTIYILQQNTEEGCYEESTYEVTITAAVQADVFEDLVLSCTVHQLAPLSPFNKYYTEADGKGEELAVGSLIPFGRVIYIYAASADGLCTDQSNYTVTYEECPIPKGISPNGDGLNDRFDLSQHGATSLTIYNRYGVEVYNYEGNYTNQWFGQGTKGNILPDGTYYYVVVSHHKTRTGWVQINK